MTIQLGFSYHPLSKRFRKTKYVQAIRFVHKGCFPIYIVLKLEDFKIQFSVKSVYANISHLSNQNDIFQKINVTVRFQVNCGNLDPRIHINGFVFGHYVKFKLDSTI